MSGEVELTVPADPPPLTEPATATAPKSRVSTKHGVIGLVGIVAVAALVVGIVALGRDGALTTATFDTSLACMLELYSWLLYLQPIVLRPLTPRSERHRSTRP